MTPLLAALVLLGTPHSCARMCPLPEGYAGVVRLGLGTQKVLTFDGGFESRVEGAAQVKDIGKNQLLIIGAQEGFAEHSSPSAVAMWRKTRRSRVVPSSAAPAALTSVT